MLYLLLRSRKDAGYRQRFAERFALKLPAASAKNGIVLHRIQRMDSHAPFNPSLQGAGFIE